MAAVPAPVIELVERFARNRDAYVAGGINEIQLRREFINPSTDLIYRFSPIGTDLSSAFLPIPPVSAFISVHQRFLLGWDIENKQGYAPAYREVIFENSVKVRGSFDAVIGNPPYVRVQSLKEWTGLEVEWYRRHCKSAGKGCYDIGL